MPVPLHLWQRPVPVQKGQTSALSSIVAVESSDADRSGLSVGIDCGCSGVLGQTDFYSLPPQGILRSIAGRGRVWGQGFRDMFLTQRFARQTSPLATSIIRVYYGIPAIEGGLPC